MQGLLMIITLFSFFPFLSLTCHSLVSAGTHIVAAAAGRYSSMALNHQGQLYAWGFEGCASAGKVPPQTEAYKPRLMLSGGLEGKRVVAFDIGELGIFLTFLCRTLQFILCRTKRKKFQVGVLGVLACNELPTCGKASLSSRNFGCIPKALLVVVLVVRTTLVTA
jgi:hypothetical protein